MWGDGGQSEWELLVVLGFEETDSALGSWNRWSIISQVGVAQKVLLWRICDHHGLVELLVLLISRNWVKWAASFVFL